MQVYDKFFIGGKWVDPAGTDTLDVASPSTEEIIGRVPVSTEADMDHAVAAARAAFDNGPWPHMSPAERADILEKISQTLQAQSEDLAKLISTEVGAPYLFSLMGQVLAATMVLDKYV